MLVLIDVVMVEGRDFKNFDVLIDREMLDDVFFVVFVFKVMIDLFVGRLIFFRVYFGFVEKGVIVFNLIKGKKERMGRIF